MGHCWFMVSQTCRKIYQMNTNTNILLPRKYNIEGITPVRSSSHKLIGWYTSRVNWMDNLIFRKWNTFHHVSHLTNNNNCHCNLQCTLGILMALMMGTELLNSCRSGSTLAQVMACCLMAPSNYLNWCWLVISGALWHFPNTNYTSAQYINSLNEFGNTFVKLLFLTVTEPMSSVTKY